MPDEQAPQPAVDLGPLPLTWGTAIATMQIEGKANPDKMVVVQFITPQGNSSFFFDGASACKLAASIMEMGRQVMAYEQVVNPQIIVPGVNGGEPH